MDKSWMQKGKCSIEYLEGCQEFVEFAWNHRTSECGDLIYCPCTRCKNNLLFSKEEVQDHLYSFGIVRTYIRWTKHGEVSNDEREDSNNDMLGMLQDAFRIPNLIGRDFEVPNEQPSQVEPGVDEFGLNESLLEEPNEEAQKFFRLLKEAETPLYPGCTKSSKLSFLVRLLHVKCINRWSNTSFDMLLELLLDSFDTLYIPKNHYEAKKQLRDLGMSVIKIDACPNDCMLYWKDKESNNECDTCGVSRWQLVTTEESSKNKKKAAKVLRYFPLKPRLERLYMCSKTSEDMIWHANDRIKDGILRHPADSKVWQTLDQKHPSFGLEPRNVRLGLASDCFNPFGNMSTSHSTWPIILIPYNLLPWTCMKQSSFIMSALIPGPSAPGNNIDVYLQPLFDELLELWSHGVETYDAYSKQNFRMHAAFLWTINDFPAYANLSGWSTKGYLACPCCHMYTSSDRLAFGNKCCYMGHRRFLPADHPFRINESSFNGNIEMGTAPQPLTGSDVLEQLHGYDQITFGKGEYDKAGQKRRRDDDTLPHNWKKISIFSQLPYYKDLLLPHNLDVMHIEKNNGESLVGTLLNIDGKTKDTLKARQDLQLMGLRPSLHPIPRGDNKFYLPSASYSMFLEEKRRLCQYIKDVKTPDNYCSNISRRVQVKECKIPGLKSHDWHILVQQILPVAARGILSKEVTIVLVELSMYFRKLCSKVLIMEELEQIEAQIGITLCKMEMIFPPAFFDVMIHLPIHLAREAMLAGPVNYRWMYPIERYLCTLKKYVRNKSRPEGSIVEGYLAEECLTFCSRYLDGGIETRVNRPGRNSDDGVVESSGKLPVFATNGRTIGKANLRNLTEEEWEQTRLYVLNNSDEVTPFIEKHKQMIKDTHEGDISAIDLTKAHNEKFGAWFEHHVREMKAAGVPVNEELEKLSIGPSRSVACFKGYIVNGFRFHTKKHERTRKTQNSGVFLTAETSNFANTRDDNPLTNMHGYYGVLNDVVELYYHGLNRITLFKCEWFDVLNNAGIKEDEYGFTTINFTRRLASNEPFILGGQAQQCFYLKDNLDEDWRVVLKTPARDFYDMVCAIDPLQESLSTNDDVSLPVGTTQAINDWSRIELDGMEVTSNTIGRDQAITGNGDYEQDFIEYESAVKRTMMTRMMKITFSI